MTGLTLSSSVIVGMSHNLPEVQFTGVAFLEWGSKSKLYRADIRQKMEKSFHNIWYRISTQVTGAVLIYDGYYLP